MPSGPIYDQSPIRVILGDSSSIYRDLLALLIVGSA